MPFCVMISSSSDCLNTGRPSPFYDGLTKRLFPIFKLTCSKFCFQRVDLMQAMLEMEVSDDELKKGASKGMQLGKIFLYAHSCGHRM